MSWNQPDYVNAWSVKVSPINSPLAADLLWTAPWRFRITANCVSFLNLCLGALCKFVSGSCRGGSWSESISATVFLSCGLHANLDSDALAWTIEKISDPQGKSLR